jgi:hypothetical protein
MLAMAQVSHAIDDSSGTGGDVAQAHARVVGDAQQHPAVIGQETSACHDDS